MTPIKILFLCTGNSSRSILCEATLNHLDRTRFLAYSAGSQPAGRVNPWALRELTRLGISTDGLRSKCWDEYTGPDAPAFDLVITVCDGAASEPCPVFFGDFVRAHWGLPDPTFVSGDADVLAEAFRRTQAVISQRIQALVALPLREMAPEEMRIELEAITARYPSVDLVVSTP